MKTKFKRHQLVKIMIVPDLEYVEYHNENEDNIPDIPIKAGMKGRINIILPNGQYHVEILDAREQIFAYAPFNEEDLEAL